MILGLVSVAMYVSAYNPLALAALGLALVLSFQLWSVLAMRVSRVSGSLLLLGIVTLALGLAQGTYPLPTSVGVLTALMSTEGRWILALAIVPPFAALPPRVASETLLAYSKVLLWLATASLATAVTGIGINQTSGNLHGFAGSHHSIGFLFGSGMIVAFFCRDLASRQRYLLLALTAANVLWSGSRAVLIAVGLALFAVGIGEIVRRRKAKRLALPFLGLALSSFASERIRETISWLSEPSSWQAFWSVVVLRENLDRSGPMSQAIGNVLNRFEIWGETLDVFRSSPLVGVGPGGLNDVLIGGGQRILSEGSAHNALLQYLAEGGIILGFLYVLSCLALLSPPPGLTGRSAVAARALGLFVLALGLPSAGFLTFIGVAPCVPVVLLLRMHLLDRMKRS